jgi:hypothetical protein
MKNEEEISVFTVFKYYKYIIRGDTKMERINNTVIEDAVKIISENNIVAVNDVREMFRLQELSCRYKSFFGVEL